MVMARSSSIKPTTNKIKRCQRCRQSASMFSFTLAALAATALVLHVAPKASAQFQQPMLESIEPIVLRSNMRYWTTDYAVLFYGSQCQHCRDTHVPLWNLVAEELAKQDPKGKKKLTLATFNCDQDIASSLFCQEIGVTHYPEYYYYGSETFHDHDPITGLFRKPPTVHASSAKFPHTKVFYPDSVYDWVKVMNNISRFNRFIQRLNPLTRRRQQPAEEELMAEIEELRAAMKESAAQATAAIPDGPEYGFGDTFRELASVGHSPEFDSVMGCTIDMEQQYCKLEGIRELEPWCNTVDACSLSHINFADPKCWPESCPMQNQGCQLVSACLDPEIFKLYADAYAAMEEGDERPTVLTVGYESDQPATEQLGSNHPESNQESTGFSGRGGAVPTRGGMEKSSEEGRGDAVGV